MTITHYGVRACRRDHIMGKPRQPGTGYVIATVMIDQRPDAGALLRLSDCIFL